MKLNISYPATGCQKLIEIEDEHKIRPFYEKRMATEMDAGHLGDEWKGYVVRIAGGNDKQGFPMKQGILTAGRVRLLLGKGHSCFRPRRTGERRRKSVRGCIVDANLSVLSLVIIKKGEQEIPGLTDKNIPRRLGPKRASKIRKLFNLSKEDDVRQYVVRRPMPAKEGKKPTSKAPKIQRLITPVSLQRKRRVLVLKKRRHQKRREDAAAYAKLLAQRVKEAKDRKAERRRSASHRSSISKSESQAVEIVKKDKKKPVKDAKSASKDASKGAKTAKAAAAPAGKKPTKAEAAVAKGAAKAKAPAKGQAPPQAKGQAKGKGAAKGAAPQKPGQKGKAPAPATKSAGAKTKAKK